MKIKTEELERIALDWAVAKCEGLSFTERLSTWKYKWNKGLVRYSTDWSLAGPIIEKEQITLVHFQGINRWRGSIYTPNGENMAVEGRGPTPLIAAMRCYVAFKLGDEVEIPEELL